MSYRFRTGGWRATGYGGWGGSGWLGGLLTPMVKKLMLANAAVFAATFLLGVFAPDLQRAVIRLFGTVPQEVVFRARVWQLASYMFLHGDLWHLLMNLLALWMFGTDLERQWGGRRFLKFYFLAGVGAALLNVAACFLLGRDLVTPTIGASGAIYGILLAFGLLYPTRPILIIPFPVAIPAKLYVLIMGTITFLSSLRASGGISHITHLGGMVVAYLYLRGDWMYYRALARYHDWRRRRLRRQFDVYLHEQEGKESRGRHDRWVH